ncbi:GNAT family N-acetyltransferase [Paenimyroides ceti]
MNVKHPELDNPVWYSLQETHQAFCTEHAGMKFYLPEMAPFGAFSDVETTFEGTASYAHLCHDFYVVGERPDVGNGLILKKELVCDQMILENPCEILFSEEIVLLDRNRRRDLAALVNRVQPGYFKDETAVLGNYYGIYVNGILVAVTGERMQMNAYKEISAVVTHPDYTGKGYAGQLVAFVANAIIAENKMPFLHVAASNSRAIQLYEKLGFVKRRSMSFWNLSLT